jgi:F0F1-type ATP synthase membrane subunit b/b'
VKFDASLLVVVVIFGITYLLLKVLLFDPLLRIMNRREKRVEDARNAWQQATAHVEAAVQQERQRLLAARRDATARRDTARREALDQRRVMLEEAKGEAQQQLDAARAELAGQVATERRALEGRANALAGSITERLVGRAM